ncbi:E3 ubiquitin-protein ligase RNF115-like isoform X2 [Antedon mediterranea]|uniref:E3 ubiquitin-protein ligase RNF115-like isoform X2 n=1 Tax=Antedon mediterranea TaxID=105859 RepID=UPI003AF75B15
MRGYVRLLADYTCPRCSTGFVEELDGGTTQQTERTTEHERESRPSTDPDSSLTVFNQLWMQLGSADGPQEPAAPVITTGRRRFPVRVRQLGRDAADPAQDMIMILQHLLGMGGVGSGHPFPVQLMNLHGRPGDYAWGERGLDTIITQLLSNLEGGGPPPAEKTDIDKLPIVKITKIMVENHSECAVCKEEYTEDEEVRKMPCEHLFHSDCIIPWLEMHNTCPVCRKSLDGRYTRNDFTEEDENGPPEDTEDRTSEMESSNTTTGQSLINNF